MELDDHVCLCYRVSLRKLINYMNRCAPAVPSQLGDCLGAGTGCHWCVPFLRRIHEQWSRGETPKLPLPPAEYAERRLEYHRTGKRSASPERPG